MFVSDETIRVMEAKYGVPREARFRFPMGEREFDLLLSSMKDSRSHDVTLFIMEGDEVVVIRKPSHPPGVYRAPSGGLRPGEDFERGARREAREETGLEVELDRYILRSHVVFHRGPLEVEWTTHVFTAHRAGGDLKPLDTKEISEVRTVNIHELNSSIREHLLSSASGGLHYRAALTEMVVSEMEKMGGASHRRKGIDRRR